MMSSITSKSQKKTIEKIISLINDPNDKSKKSLKT